MNITQIQYVLAVAECGSISRAASKLFVSQPALSLQIKKLEQELGFSLFFRTAQGVSLTEEGNLFCADARAVRQAWDTLRETGIRLGGKQRERISVHLGPRVFSNGLFPKIVAFFEQHPQMEPTFIMAGGGSFLEDLKRGDIDVALNYLPSEDALTDARRFSCCELIRERHCLLTGQGTALAERKSVSYHDLTDLTIIAAPEDSLEAQIMNRMLQKYGVTPGRMYRLDGIDTTMEMIRGGTGVALGPESFAAYYGVCTVPLEPPVEESLYFVCLREKQEQTGIRALRKYLRENC